MARVTEIFAQFFAPLLDGLQDVRHMQGLLSDLGVEVRLTAAHQTVFQDIMPLIQTLTDIENAAQAGGEDDDPSDLDKAFLALDALAALSSVNLSDIAALPGVLSDENTWVRIGRELPGYLLLTWLDDVLPVIPAVLNLGGAIEVIPRGAGKVPRRVLDWQAMGALVQNPPEQISQTWDYGGDTFNSDGFLVAVAELIETLGGAPRVIGLPPVVEAALGDHAPAAGSRAIDGRLFQGTTPDGTAAGLFSLILSGASRANAAGTAGLAVMPMLSGNFNLTRPIDEDETISLGLTASGTAAGGAGLVILPQGPEVILGQGAANATATLSLSGAPEDGWIVIGSRNASHLRIDRFSFDTRISTAPPGVDITMDLMDAVALKVKASEGGDGLINTILGGVEVEVFGGFSANWSDNSGWSFAGGLGLEIEIPINREIGPFTVDSITLLGAAGTEGFSAGAAVTGSFTLGPIWLFFDEIGVIADLTPMPDGQTGTFGAVDVQPRFKPPEGYGARLDFEPITGGGLIQKNDTEYRGALELSFSKFGLSAFAILNTELPGGQPGFSFAASVFATFNVPLAMGFFLTGCGGMLGINRTVDTDAMREVLFDGRLDDLLFPSDPIGMAPRILEDMAAIMPAAAGQHFMGPVVRISWGQPTLVHITLGVIIEVGPVVRLVILGSIKMALPDEDYALVIFQLSFFGEIDFSAGTVDFDASLQGSRVLIFTITGDAAVRTGWGPDIFQIASLGGLHPQYPKPDNLPDLRRLSAGFGNPGDAVRLSLWSYFAQTLNSVQFGAGAELFAQGPRIPFLGRVTAEGSIGFEALIYFNPFSFLVDLYGGISLMVNGKVKAALYFAISLRGPNPFFISGEVWVKVCKINVRFSVTHTFGQPETVPNATASAVDALRQALSAQGTLQAGSGSGAGQITFRHSASDAGLIEPMGALSFAQSAVPLDVAIEKLGEADVEGHNALTLLVRDGNGDVADVSAVQGDFVKAHFFEATEAERLRAPSFETHDAGCAFAASGFSVVGASHGEEYDYEIIVIDERPAVKLPRFLDGLSKEDMLRFSGKFAEGRSQPLGTLAEGLTARDGVTRTQSGYLLEKRVLEVRDAAHGRDMPVEDIALNATSGAISRLGKPAAAAQPNLNAAVVDYLSAA